MLTTLKSFWLRLVPTRGVCMRGVAVMAALVGMIGATEGRPLVACTDYENVSLDELVSAYKQAYTEAGFEFKKQTILKEAEREGRNIELIFEYPNPDYPQKGKGVVSFNIVLPTSANQNCTPCHVYPQVFGGGALLQYDLLEYGEFMERLISADLKANEQIRKKLGKSARRASPRVTATGRQTADAPPE